MACNVGKIDALLRFIIGIGILVTGIFMHNFIGLLGLILIFTGITRRCVIYFFTGISTYPKSDDE